MLLNVKIASNIFLIKVIFEINHNTVHRLETKKGTRLFNLSGQA